MADDLTTNVRIYSSSENPDTTENDPFWLYTETRHPHGPPQYSGNPAERRITAPFIITTDDVTSAGEYATVDAARRAKLRERLAELAVFDGMPYGSAFITNDRDAVDTETEKWWLHRLRPYADRIRKTQMSVEVDPAYTRSPYTLAGTFSIYGQVMPGVSGGRTEDPPEDPQDPVATPAPEGAEPDYTEMQITYARNGRQQRVFTSYFTATSEEDEDGNLVQTSAEANYEAAKADVYQRLGLSSDGSQGGDGFVLEQEHRRSEVEADSGNNALWVTAMSKQLITVDNADVRDVSLGVTGVPVEEWDPSIGGERPWHVRVSGSVTFDVSDGLDTTTAREVASDLAYRAIQAYAPDALLIAGSTETYNEQTGVCTVNHMYRAGNTDVIAASRRVSVTVEDDAIYTRDSAGKDWLQRPPGNRPATATVVESVMRLGREALGRPKAPPVPGWAEDGSAWYFAGESPVASRRDIPMAASFAELVGSGGVAEEAWQQTRTVRYRLLNLADGIDLEAAEEDGEGITF